MLKSSIGANADIISVNSVGNEELWSPMLNLGAFHKDTIISVPTTPNLPVNMLTGLQYIWMYKKNYLGLQPSCLDYSIRQKCLKLRTMAAMIAVVGLTTFFFSF